MFADNRPLFKPYSQPSAIPAQDKSVLPGALPPAIVALFWEKALTDTGLLLYLPVAPGPHDTGWL